MNSIAVKFDRVNALVLKTRNYVNIKILKNIYFAILDSHQRYSCVVWAQNINAVRRLIIIQRKHFQ